MKLPYVLDHDGFVQLLIKVNANVNGKTFEGLTPAILAAKKNQTDVLKVLIENGSDINAQGDYISTTALHEAAYEGHLQAVMVLIENGANIDQQDEVDYTPLIVATESDQNLKSQSTFLKKGLTLIHRIYMEQVHFLVPLK